MNIDWIPVTERLPEPYLDVQVAILLELNGAPIVMIGYVDRLGVWHEDYLGMQVSHPSHWAPLLPHPLEERAEAT